MGCRYLQERDKLDEVGAGLYPDFDVGVVDEFDVEIEESIAKLVLAEVVRMSVR